MFICIVCSRRSLKRFTNPEQCELLIFSYLPVFQVLERYVSLEMEVIKSLGFFKFLLDLFCFFS